MCRTREADDEGHDTAAMAIADITLSAFEGLSSAAAKSPHLKFEFYLT